MRNPLADWRRHRRRVRRLEDRGLTPAIGKILRMTHLWPNTEELLSELEERSDADLRRLSDKWRERVPRETPAQQGETHG